MEDLAWLNTCFNGKKIQAISLLYSGSRDGWMSADFHRLCDNKGPTKSLFKIDNGKR